MIILSEGNNQTVRLIVAIALMTAAIFTLDLLIPLGVAAGVPYIAPVLVSMWVPGRWYTLALVIAVTVFIVLGFVHSPLGGELWQVLINRTLALFVIWGTALLVLLRKQVENDLKQSERRLKYAQNIGKIGDWEYDIDNNRITWSEETFVLYERDPLQGPPTVEEEAAYYSLRQNKFLKDNAGVAIENEKDLQYDLQVELPSGREVYYSATVNPVKDENGHVNKLFGTVQDITERKQAEEEQEAIGRIGSIITSSLDIHEVYQEFTSQLGKLVDFDRASITLTDKSGQTARSTAVFDEVLLDAVLSEMIFPLKGSALEWLIANKRTHLIQNLEQEQPFSNSVEDFKRGLRSSLRVPLFSKDEVIGAINLQSKAPNAFGEREAKIVSRVGGQLAVAIANARLFAEQKRRAEEMAALQGVSQAVSGSLELEAVAALSLEATLGVLGLDAGVIRYLNEDTQELLVLSHQGLTPEVAEHLPQVVRVGEGLPGRAAELGEPLVAEDLSRDNETFFTLWQQFGFQSAAFLPLKVKDSIVGIMVGFSRTRRTFTTADMEMMASLSYMVGMAIANARLFEGQKRRTDQVTALQQVGQAVSRSLDLEAVSSMAVEATIGVLNLDAGAIYHIDEVSQKLFLLAHWGLPAAMVTWIREVIDGQEIGIGFMGQAVRSGQPVVVEDVPQQARHSSIVQSGFESAIYLPLKVQDRVVGVITGWSHPKRTFTPDDMEMMTSLGNMAGMAIANARLFHQVEATGEELRQTADDLARSNADLQQFAYVASHDLQEPLRMVESYVQLLARRYQSKLDADADEFIGYAVEGTNRMHALINDLLEYSRMGTEDKQMEPIDSSDVLAVALDNLKAALRESGAVVTQDALPTVVADASQLAQLFQNLIGNAIKFHGQEPLRVHVSAERKGDEWVFSVRDNGIGLDTDFSDRIFVIFQRLNSRTEYPGTGIGLAICKRIVERHGGRIWVESEPGKGSTLYFTIPVREISNPE